jgi:hypothetical protein
MSERYDALIHGYLDESLTDDELAELGVWIEASPTNAKRFSHEVMLHDRLHFELNRSEMDRTFDEHSTESIASATNNTTEIESHQLSPVDTQLSPEVKRRTPKWTRLRKIAIATAAIIPLAISSYLWTLPDGAPSPGGSLSFVSVTQVSNVDWGNSTEFRRGDSVAGKTLDLQSGFIRLQFIDGVEVTLQGPAKFELTAPGQVRLSSGLLTATVPPGAEGFFVDTPSAKVTDLGTSFGIQLGDDGISNVSVFDGEVDIAPKDSKERMRLTEGEAVRIASGRKIETVEWDTAAYEKVWPISSGIKTSSGAFRFTPPWPRRIRFVRSDDEVFVLPEGYRTTLSNPLTVDITEPGEYRLANELATSEISAGIAVRSFILHFHPENKSDRNRFDRTTGSITFDHPVLGIIARHEQLAASADTFPGRRAGELLEHRQLELTGTPVGDVVQLSEDRHTVYLDLGAPGRFSDMVRVIVDARPTER